MDDIKEKIEYYCEFCQKRYTSIKFFKKHVTKCMLIKQKIFLQEEENITYVKCKICSKIFSDNLVRHLHTQHNMTRETYIQQYNSPVISENASKNYQIKSNWIQRKKDAGEDLSEYKQKMSKAVSDAIMANPKERQRRSDLLGNLNKSPQARQLASETAKKTSTRTDVLAARASRMHHVRNKSQGEQVLFVILEPLGFKYGHMIHDLSFTTKTHRRILDFIHLDNKIIIEYDGGQHFKTNFKQKPVEYAYIHDEQLNNWAVKNGYCIIRISYEYFHYRKKIFSQSLIDEMLRLIENPTIAIHKLGNKYTTCQT